MYSFEQDHTAAARITTTTFDTSYLQPCAAAGRSLQQLSSAHHHHPGQQVHQTAAGSVSGSAAVQQPRRATKSSKKHAAAAAASRHSSSSRRSSTTVVATDVNNFRAMVQELTGFPPAAIFRPLPRRVHAASPFAAIAAAAGQGCGGREQHGRYGSSEATHGSTTAGGSSSSPDAPPVLPFVAQEQQPQFPPLGEFDGLSDLGSPEFDSWGDLSID